MTAQAGNSKTTQRGPHQRKPASSEHLNRYLVAYGCLEDVRMGKVA